MRPMRNILTITFADMAAIATGCRAIVHQSFAKATANEAVDSVLCRMVDIRRRVDRGPLKYPRGRNWPVFALWTAPEGKILCAIRSANWLQDGGLSALQAWASVCPSVGAQISAAADEAAARRIAIYGLLQVIDPQYLSLGDKMIDHIVRRADAWAKREIVQVNTSLPYPPPEWLELKVSLAEFERECLEPFSAHTIWTRSAEAAQNVGAWFTPDDEIWWFRSPPDYWAGMFGRAGYALLRRGRPIAHATTIMN